MDVHLTRKCTACPDPKAHTLGDTVAVRVERGVTSVQSRRPCPLHVMYNTRHMTLLVFPDEFGRISKRACLNANSKT